jgi:hypothetical protein
LVKKCFDGKNPLFAASREIESPHLITDGPRDIAQIASPPVAPCQAIAVQESMAESVVESKITPDNAS